VIKVWYKTQVKSLKYITILRSHQLINFKSLVQIACTVSFMSRHQTAGQSNYIRVANKSFEKVVKFKYLGSTLTDQNCIHEEISCRLNSGNACYHAVQNLLSSCLLSISVKIKIYKTIILPVVLYECEAWSLTLREEHRLRVFENRS
jgi:hypothetical protein